MDNIEIIDTGKAIVVRAKRDTVQLPLPRPQCGAQCEAPELSQSLDGRVWCVCGWEYKP